MGDADKAYSVLHRNCAKQKMQNYCNLAKAKKNSALMNPTECYEAFRKSHKRSDAVFPLLSKNKIPEVNKKSTHVPLER